MSATILGPAPIIRDGRWGIWCIAGRLVLCRVVLRTNKGVPLTPSGIMVAEWSGQAPGGAHLRPRNHWREIDSGAIIDPAAHPGLSRFLAIFVGDMESLARA